MKRFNRANLVIAVMTAFNIVTAVSTVAGTLAWYAYATRSVISFTGMSVRQSIQLEVGIVDDLGWFSSEELYDYNLERENITSDTHSIAWCRGSSLTSDALAAYLRNSPYAINELSPVSTLGRTDTQALSLYEAPEAGSRCGGFDSGADKNRAADTHNYIQIPFAFRVMNSNEELVEDQPIWITDAVVASSHYMEQAVRIFNDDITNDTRFLFKPASLTTDDPAATVMAGSLDLDGDHYYDFDSATGHEYVYGDVEIDGVPSYQSAFADDTLYVDMNETGSDSQDDEHASTFYAKHKKYAKAIDFTNINKKTATYQTKKTVFPSVNGEGEYVGGMPVTVTPNTTSKIGYATLTIFLEGWDHVIIDKVVGDAFYLGLQFEINRLQ